MSIPVLLTKLFVPETRPELVSRSGLIEKLNDGLFRKLTLISAPAGFGKTTVVMDWGSNLQRESPPDSPIKIAWYSLDVGDNDPRRFLTYLIAALNQIYKKDSFGETSLSMLDSPQSPSSETVLTLLINEISAIPDKIVFVLDDYHLIESQPVHDALAYLIENLPTQLHMVITTREDPPIQLSRLRARNQLSEIRAIDLCFTAPETAEFLNRVMGLKLSSEDISALNARTEGWIAGLQLAAISIQGSEDASSFIRSFTGSNRLILDYLIEEVLLQQKKDIQTFMLQTAFLDRLTGSLCNAVTGQENGQETLEILERSNLFIIPLDHERRWYRYHHLFADLLHQRLVQSKPEQLSKLHKRASIWYSQQGFNVEAIDHALHGRDYERAIGLINANIESNYENVALLTLQRWLAAIPDNLTSTHPQILLLKAWYEFNTGQIEEADQSLINVTQLLETDDLLDHPTRATLSGQALAIQSFITSLRGDYVESEQFARKALDLLPITEHAWRSGVTITLGEACAAQGLMTDAQHFRIKALQLSQSAGNPIIIMIANLNLAETLYQQGQVMKVIEICQQQMQFATDHGLADTPIIGWLLGLWGAALAEMNQLDKALELSQNGVELAEHGQDMFYINNSYMYRMQVLFSAMEWALVDDILQRLGQMDSLAHWIISQISAWQIRIWLKEDKLDVAAQWLNEANLNIEADFLYIHEADFVAMARVLLALGQLDSAADLLARLQEAAEAGGRYRREIELLLLRALTEQARDNLQQAHALLEQALILGEPRNIIRTFVDEGPDLARLLYDAVKQDVMTAYVQQIIAAFPFETPQTIAKQLLPEGEWVEPLTERELEILLLVAKGLTNPDIGNRLYLSANTVKTHLRNIYGKLGVNNRTQAVARGRGLGIIVDK